MGIGKTRNLMWFVFPRSALFKKKKRGNRFSGSGGQNHRKVILKISTRIDFLFFFGNKALLAKTNHISFLALLIPNYMQNTKEIDFSTTAAKLKFCFIFTESRSLDSVFHSS